MNSDNIIRRKPERESTVKKNGIMKIESGVDWLTVTGTSLSAWERVGGMALTLASEQIERGERPRQTRRHGYHITTVGQIEYGTGSQGWMVVLRGELAEKYWMPFSAYATNVTRVDLQSTVWMETYNADAIKEIFSKAQSLYTGSRPPNVTLIDNQRKGHTLYYGSRASAQFGRVYDKYAQQNKDASYLNAIRYEVEFKKPLAGEVMRWLLMKEPRVDEITARVFSWFADRNIETPLDLTIPDNAIQYPRKETPIEKKLEWLRKSVRPVYRQLVALGFQIEADGNIGVTDDAITVTKIESEVNNGSG